MTFPNGSKLCVTLSAMLALTACVSVSKPDVAVNIVTTETLPEEAAVSYLQKTINTKWDRWIAQDVAPSSPYCKFTEPGNVTGYKASGIIGVSKVKKTNAIPYELASYSLSVVESSSFKFYEMWIIPQKSSKLKPCSLTGRVDVTPQSEAKIQKIVTALESLGISRTEL